jgi:hypothetical protein
MRRAVVANTSVDIAGEIVAMSGGTITHGRLIGRTSDLLNRALDGLGDAPHGEHTSVSAPPSPSGIEGDAAARGDRDRETYKHEPHRAHRTPMSLTCSIAGFVTELASSFRRAPADGVFVEAQEGRALVLRVGKARR